MTRKRITLLVFSTPAVAGVLGHAQQVWPVENEDVVGVYRNIRDSKDAIYLRSNGEYLHQTDGRRYVGRWSLNRWDGDVSLVNVRFVGQVELNAPYIVGSRFGRVENLYLSNKSAEEWRKE